MGGCAWVCVGVRACMGMFRCKQVHMGMHGCEWVCVGVHGCACMGVCAWVCVHGCVFMGVPGVRGYA